MQRRQWHKINYKLKTENNIQYEEGLCFHRVYFNRFFAYSYGKRYTVNLYVVIFHRHVAVYIFACTYVKRYFKREKMQAFKELVATRNEAKKYLPDDFDPDAELEAARREKYGSID